MKTIYALLIALFLVNGAMAQWFWQNPLPQGDHLHSVYFTDANTGYATSYNGTILKTTDGGITWTAQSSGTYDYLISVFFTDTNTGYAVGDGGTILKTTNGGTDWIVQTSGTTNGLMSVYFTDANTGYAVGYNGIILKTTNGGTDWIVQASGTYSWLYSVYFTDANTGYAVGEHGTILKTENGGGFPIGIGEQMKGKNNLSIYPNPTSNTITIGTPSTGIITIHNPRGQQLLQQKITESITTIDVSNMPGGMYVVKVIGENGVKVGKFVKL